MVTREIPINLAHQLRESLRDADVEWLRSAESSGRLTWLAPFVAKADWQELPERLAANDVPWVRRVIGVVELPDIGPLWDGTTARTARPVVADPTRVPRVQTGTTRSGLRRRWWLVGAAIAVAALVIALSRYRSSDTITTTAPSSTLAATTTFATVAPTTVPPTTVAPTTVPTPTVAPTTAPAAPPIEVATIAPPPPPAADFVIYFDMDVAVIRADGHPTLATASARIATLPAGTKVNVTGVADQQGNALYNEQLSQLRAQAVIAELKADGATNVEYITGAKGAETNENFAQSRRVEIDLP